MHGAVYPPPTQNLPHLVVILTDDGLIANVSTARSLSEGETLLGEILSPDLMKRGADLSDVCVAQARD